jgi:hypothetical protein
MKIFEEWLKERLGESRQQNLKLADEIEKEAKNKSDAEKRIYTKVVSLLKTSDRNSAIRYVKTQDADIRDEILELMGM